MAESSVSLGLDLTSFVRSLREAQDELGKGAARALAQAKVASIEAMKEGTRFAREQLRAQQEASRAEQEAAREAARLAREAAREQARAAEQAIRDAQRLAEEERRVGEARASAATKLQGLAAQRSEVEALTFAYRQQVAEIERLGAVSGDTSAMEQALAVATQKHQTELGKLKAATNTATTAMTENRGEMWKTQVAGQMFRKNIGDIAAGLFYGADAMTVMSQQAPDLIQSITDAGGVGNAAKAAFGGFGQALAGAAPIIGIVVAAAVALASTLTILTNQYELANSATLDMNRATEAARENFERARKAAIPYGEAMRTLTKSVEDQREAYEIKIGTMSEVDAAERKALAAAEARNREAVLGIQAMETAARAERQRNQELLNSGKANFLARDELRKRNDELDKLIPTLTAQARATQDQHAQELELIKSSAEYDRELAKSNEFLEEREKRTRAATEAMQAQAEAEREVAARIKAINQLLREQEALAEAAFRWRMELDAAQNTAADLARAGVEMQDLVRVLEEAGTALETESALEFQRNLAQAYKDAEALRDVFEVKITSVLQKAAQLAKEFTSALGGQELRTITDIFRDPGRAVASLGKGLAEAQTAAAESLADAKAAYQETLGQGDVKATQDARKALDEARRQMENTSPKAFIRDMLGSAMSYVTTLAQSGPALIKQLVKQAPKFIHALVAAAPDIIVALIRNVPTLAIELATAFAIELPIAIIAKLPAIVKALALGIGEAFIQAGRNIRRVFRDILREISSGGRRETRTFGDTPGPVRMDRATTARFSPGDYVIAARTREGLRAQAGASAVGGQAGGSVVALDLRYGPMALGLAMAHADLNRRGGVGRDTTGRDYPRRR